MNMGKVHLKRFRLRTKKENITDNSEKGENVKETIPTNSQGRKKSNTKWSVSHLVFLLPPPRLAKSPGMGEVSVSSTLPEI